MIADRTIGPTWPTLLIKGISFNELILCKASLSLLTTFLTAATVDNVSQACQHMGVAPAAARGGRECFHNDKVRRPVLCIHPWALIVFAASWRPS